MAGYFLYVKVFSRGKGGNAVKAAAYRAGERIQDERSRAVYNYEHRDDVAHAEIVLPEELADSADMKWALDRVTLWNAAQHSGRLRNSRVAREVLVHLEAQMTVTQRVSLVKGLAQELANRYGTAVDFAVHAPRAEADERHHHAHLLMTCRQVGPGGIGARTALELSGTERHERGLGPSRNELLWLRERWAVVTNDALREAGLPGRVDHRSYKDQGINREPVPMMPQSIYYKERLTGKGTPAGDDIRARYRERVEARLKGPEELARVVKRQREDNRRQAIEWAARKAAHPEIPQRALTKEERSQKRREYRNAHREEINRKVRERRRATASEGNRKQREYRLAHGEELRRKEREKYRQRVSQRKEHQPPPLATKKHTTSQSAEASAKNWLSLREKQKAAPAEQSASRWLTYRQAQARGEAPARQVRDAARETKSAGKGDPKDGAGANKSGRDRKNDTSL